MWDYRLQSHTGVNIFQGKEKWFFEKLYTPWAWSRILQNIHSSLKKAEIKINAGHFVFVKGNLSDFLYVYCILRTDPYLAQN